MREFVPASASDIPPWGYRSSWSWPEDDLEFSEHLAWFEDNLRIVDESDTVIPFELTPEQKSLEFYKWQCKKEDRPAWILILKARKLGCSTWACGTFFRDGLEQDNIRSYTMAHDDDSTAIIFEMTQNFHAFLETPPSLSSASAKELRLETNNSSFRVRTAGAGGRAGRAGTFTRCHLSEVDRYPDPHGLYGAVVNSVPESSHVVIVVESTAEGPGLLMDELWRLSLEKRNEFMPFFFPWWESKKYRRDPTWNDLLSYAPRDWIIKNRRFVEEAQTAHLKSLTTKGGKYGWMGGSGGAGERRVSGLDRLQQTQHGGQGEGDPKGGSESRGSESPERDERPHGTDEEEGARSGGRIPGPDERGEDPLGHGGHEDAIGDGQFPETRGDDPGGRGRVHDGLGPIGLDPSFPGRFDSDEGGEVHSRDARGVRPLDLSTVFKESLTEYEKALIEKENVDLSQINWLRYCLDHRCKGDENRRKREFPSYPEEPFEAAGSDILDARVLAKWMQERRTTPIVGKGSMHADIDQITQAVRRVWFDSDDRNGKIEVYEIPNPKCRYVLAVDTAQGNLDGDWIVGFVLNAETGDQAAEFRAKLDPDLCVDQLEYLALWFKASTQRSALVMIEMNAGFGGPFMRHFADRGTCEIYEREQLDRITKQLTKRHGWMTSVQTRPQMVAELKYATRTEAWKIKSEETLSEARQLWESPIGKVESRPGFHDDGVFAGAIALMGRNWLIGIETVEKEKERRDKSPIYQFTKRLARMEREEKKGAILKIKTNMPVVVKGVGGRVLVRKDGRRSRI